MFSASIFNVKKPVFNCINYRKYFAVNVDLSRGGARSI